MSEFITIDTGIGTIKEEVIEPLPLFTDSHPMLSSKIPEYNYALPNRSMTTLVKRLKMTMKKFGGVGLSANQCGVFERVFVIGTDDFQIACINPKIIQYSDNFVKDNEGCLSYPGLFLKIERPEWIIAEFVNENGETKQVKLEGLTARCYAHELDHMNGKKFVEHCGPVALKLAKQRQQKLIKKMKVQKKV